MFLSRQVPHELLVSTEKDIVRGAIFDLPRQHSARAEDEPDGSATQRRVSASELRFERSEIGGGGNQGHCGSLDAGPTCQPLTCAAQSIKCGPAGDGCGNELQCGMCGNGQKCGAGGKPGVCAPVCQPKTCAELGFNCGPSGDGCGGELQCGTCKAPGSCGGGGKASQCGGNTSK